MHTKYIGRIDQANLERVERTISHRGVVFHELSFSSPLLNAVHQINRTPLRTVFHFDENDLSHIYIFEQPGIGFAAIPCTWFRYAKGLSLKEHRAVRSCLRKHRLPATEEMLTQVLWHIRTGERISNLDEIHTQTNEHAHHRLSRTLIPKTEKPKSLQDYTSLMARLGNEVRSFGLRGNHD